MPESSGSGSGSERASECTRVRERAALVCVLLLCLCKHNMQTLPHALPLPLSHCSCCLCSAVLSRSLLPSQCKTKSMNFVRIFMLFFSFVLLLFGHSAKETPRASVSPDPATLIFLLSSPFFLCFFFVCVLCLFSSHLELVLLLLLLFAFVVVLHVVSEQQFGACNIWTAVVSRSADAAASASACICYCYCSCCSHCLAGSLLSAVCSEEITKAATARTTAKLCNATDRERGRECVWVWVWARGRA